MLRTRAFTLGAASLITLAVSVAVVSPNAAAQAQQAAVGAPEPTPAVPAYKRSLASYAKSNTKQQCFDRKTEPYTAVTDAHFHPRPFGGEAIEPTTLFEFYDKAGVRFVTYMGIGQSLDMTSDCTYYLNCPGTSALPSIKNDFVNGQEMKAYPHDNVHITLSMTFLDLAHPETAVETIKLYDKEYPGMFKWAGEANVMKQALMNNKYEPATMESVKAWAPFMKVLAERGIPLTLHSDLGNDAEPTKFVPLMQHVLETYPNNKIVWAHMGLSKELTKMDPKQHISIMSKALDAYPNLMLDISWDVLFNSYYQYGADFIAFFNQYPTRILNGSDFVAAGTKTFEQYWKELEITSRVNRRLSDEAFRAIALGENYFKLLNLPYTAPQICSN